MKKKIFYLFPLTILLLTSCTGKTEYKLIYSEVNIVSIELGYVEDLNSDDEITQKFIVLRTLKNDEFTLLLNQLKDLECFMYYTDPGTLNNGSMSIKIAYSNGDFEIIGANGQAIYKDGYYDTCGYYYFDDVTFQELIDSWIN